MSSTNRSGHETSHAAHVPSGSESIPSSTAMKDPTNAIGSTQKISRFVIGAASVSVPKCSAPSGIVGTMEASEAAAAVIAPCTAPGMSRPPKRRSLIQR